MPGGDQGKKSILLDILGGEISFPFKSSYGYLHCNKGCTGAYISKGCQLIESNVTLK
jgi:hypothetical protein